MTRYVHGQLRPSQRARVVNHVRTCENCRGVLAREERLAADLRREMPAFGHPCPAQMAAVQARVWQDVSATRRTGGPGMTWLPGLSMALVILLVAAIALPLIMHSEIRAEAAPLQPRPNTFSTASPTPGITDESPLGADPGVYPQATVAYVSYTGASPVPVPQTTVSPVAPGSVFLGR